MRRQGFTLIEVMVSLAVMTIAGMAMLAMQQQITRGNIHARQITTATQIAQNVIERLKTDAMRWNAVGVPSGTRYLDGTQPGQMGSFTALPFVTGTNAGVTRIQSNAFDYYGDDLVMQGVSPAGLYYCASYRLSFVFDNNRVIRADVRVWWAREGMASISADFPLCADNDTNLNPGGTRIDNYHIVYLSTVLRAN